MDLIDKNATTLGLETYYFSDFQYLINADYEPASLMESGVIPDNLLGNFIERNDDGQFMVLSLIHI